MLTFNLITITEYFIGYCLSFGSLTLYTFCIKMIIVHKVLFCILDRDQGKK